MHVESVQTNAPNDKANTVLDGPPVYRMRPPRIRVRAAVDASISQ
jgi:hypothetical protein